MVCHYTPLYIIMTYYDTIMTLISIISIRTLLWQFPEGKDGIFLSKKLLVWATHLGYHVGGESQQIDRLVRWMTWTCGSWDLHTVFQPTCCVCDECPWHAVIQTRSYSGRIWSPMIWAIFSDRRVSLFPHLPRRMLWLDFNLLWISASGPIDANISETGTKHNTKRRIRTPRTLCIATDWSVTWQWMCTHHGLFHNLNENQPKC